VSLDLANIIVYGHDENHYAWRLEGINTSTLGQLVSYGGGGVLFKAPDGNSTFGGLIQIFWQNPGTAHGFHIDGAASPLNFNTFAYIQSNYDFGAGGSTTSNVFKANNLSSGNVIIMLDVEGWSGSAGGLTTDGSELYFLGGVAVGMSLNSGVGLRSFAAYQGTNPTPSNPAYIIRTGNYPGTANVWGRDFRGVPHVYAPAGTAASPISCAASTGIGGFNGGVAISKARAYLRIPSTAFTAGSPVTFYTYWDAATGSGSLQLTPYTANGNDLGGVLGFKDNHGTVSKEIQVTVYPLRTATYAIDFVADIAN
jgi:hypothetical protein